MNKNNNKRSVTNLSEHLERNESKLLSGSQKHRPDESNENIRVDTSAINEKNVSVSLSDIEAKIHKKLDYLNLSEQSETTSYSSSTTSSSSSLYIEFENAHQAYHYKSALGGAFRQQQLKNVTKMPDETIELLQELAGEDQTLRQPESEFLKAIDAELEILKKTKANRAPVAWEIDRGGGGGGGNPPAESKKEFTGKMLENYDDQLNFKFNKETQREARVSDKENVVISEASTQTSFVSVENSDCNKNKKLSKSNSLLKLDMMKKKKLKALLECQRHEKRFRELEVLAKLEKLQAEKLKKLYSEYETTGTSSILTETSSYFNEQTNISQAATAAAQSRRHSSSNNKPKVRVQSEPEDLTLVSQVDSILENLNAPSSSDQSQLKSHSKVEVIDLNNSSIMQAPKGVYVVRESCYASASSSYMRSKSTQQEHIRGHSHHHHVSAAAFDLQVSSNSENQINVKSLEKMSLQEAFEIFNRDLIMRSRKRQEQIEEKSKLRQATAEYERKRAIELELRQHEERSNLARANGGGGKVTTTSLPKRRLSIQEIKEITRKNYEKLPEVKEREHQKRLEQSKVLNRARASIYKKVNK
jgi:hypothetical protein